MLVTEKLTKRDAEFGTPKYRSAQVMVRNPVAAHKGAQAGDQVGFAKPVQAR
jgi:hypothetical protein